MRGVMLVIGIAGLLLLSTPARADLFTSSRAQTPLVMGKADETGVSLRGGVNLQTYLPPDPTLLQLQANVGGSCGGYNFAASLEQALQTIPDLFAQLIEALLSNMPMLALCYASPTLCDLAKHFQSLTNAVLQARYAQCQNIQTAMAAAGLTLRGGQEAVCLEEERKKGTPLGVALDKCLGSITQVRNPLGLPAGRVELVKEALQAAGADPETVQLANQLVGEVLLVAGGNTLQTTQVRPRESIHKRYEVVRQEVVDTLTRAVEAVRRGEAPAEADLNALALPGQPFPMAALKALALLWEDPVRREVFLTKLAATLAIARLQWELEELRDRLEAAVKANPHLTPAEQKTLEERFAQVRRELERLMREKETAERHLAPVIDALLAEQVAVQAEAARVGLQAPSQEPKTPVPFATQAPSGYGY